MPSCTPWAVARASADAPRGAQHRAATLSGWFHRAAATHRAPHSAVSIETAVPQRCARGGCVSEANQRAFWQVVQSD